MTWQVIIAALLLVDCILTYKNWREAQATSRLYHKHIESTRPRQGTMRKLTTSAPTPFQENARTNQRDYGLPLTGRMSRVARSRQGGDLVVGSTYSHPGLPPGDGRTTA